MQAGSFDKLVEGFTLFDHAELLTSALLDGLHALLELQHFGFEIRLRSSSRSFSPC